MDRPMVGGSLATAGGVVFTGESNGQFDALDARTGAMLWQFQAGAGCNAPPVTYELDHIQYVAVACGGNAQLGSPAGDALLVFALSQNPTAPPRAPKLRSSRPTRARPTPP
jgi:glucose dehydrogenase